MKLIRTIAVFLFSVWLASACAITYPENLSTLRSNVQSASGSSNVTVLLRGRTATLVGVVNSRLDENNAVRAALDSEGINKVYNQITVSDR